MHVNIVMTHNLPEPGQYRPNASSIRPTLAQTRHITYSMFTEPCPDLTYNRGCWWPGALMVFCWQLWSHVKLHLCHRWYIGSCKNGWHFADNIFNCISLTDMYHILIKISLKFAFWMVKLIIHQHHLTGAKPLPEPMLSKIHDGITKLQRV